MGPHDDLVHACMGFHLLAAARMVGGATLVIDQETWRCARDSRAGVQDGLGVWALGGGGEI